MYFFKKDKTGEIIDIVYSSKDITNEQFMLLNDEYKIGDFILNGKPIHREDYFKKINDGSYDYEIDLLEMAIDHEYRLILLELGIEV